MINRTPRFKEVELNIVGSSTFGRYPKISVERTYNMFESDSFMVPYAGYKIVITAAELNNSLKGRAIYSSTILQKMILVDEQNVYLIDIIFNPNSNVPYIFIKTLIGQLLTSETDVFIAENNSGQILISDTTALYVYDPTNLTPPLQQISIDFVPGYITFHDSYFIAASTGTNEWRLNDITSLPAVTFPFASQFVGKLETKPDNVVAVVRVPSGGNMVYVMGHTVTEPWFDNGLQLFPYQRNTGYNIDYGCINASTIAATDEVVVWLAQNEKSGPIIMFTDGGRPEKITTDGIDYLFSQLVAPEDSEAFIYRQDGHLFYHINFYTDNFSLFYDFNTKKFYHACDQNMNYFIAKEIAFFQNQYYFVSKNDGNLYAFDTIYTTYDTTVTDNSVIPAVTTILPVEIPRIRICRNVRMPGQDYFIINDIGFTIEQGTTDYQYLDLGFPNLITEDGKFLITEGSTLFLGTQLDDFLLTEDGFNLIAEQSDPNDFAFLISNNELFVPVTPRVDLALSYNGGESFGSYISNSLNPIGVYKNMLRWWQLGLANDVVMQFRFWGMGRFVVTNGLVNVRQ